MNVTFSWVTGHELHVLNDKRKKSIDGALLVREKMFSLKRHLSFYDFSIDTTWQICLHEAKPLRPERAFVCQLTLLNIDTYSNILIESSINTNIMYSRVNEKLIPQKVYLHRKRCT